MPVNKIFLTRTIHGRGILALSLLMLMLPAVHMHAQRRGKTPALKRVELFSSSRQLPRYTTVIDSFKNFQYDAVTNKVIITRLSKKKIVFSPDTVWGYKIYGNSREASLYRMDTTVLNRGALYAPRILQTDSLIIYISGYEGSKHAIYYFSKTLNSKIYQLNSANLKKVFADNAYFLELVEREMSSWTGYGLRDKKTGSFIIVELYKYSLTHVHENNTTTTSMYHLRKLKSEGKYWLFYLQVDQFQVTHNPPYLSTSVPYRALDTVTGMQQDQKVTTSSHPFHEKPLFVNFILEYNRFKNCFNIQFGFANNYVNSFHLALGYGLAHDINLSGDKRKKITIKTGFNVSYYTYSEFANQVDNRDKYLYMFGSTFHPSFTIAQTHRYSSTTYTTYRADNLKMYYSIRCWSICPQVTIANNRKQRIYWAVNAGWNIVFYDNSGLTLYQNASDYPQNDKKHIPFTNTDITSNVNGSGIFKAPFRLGGPSVGVSLGFYFNK
jgi:hypothetical protein